MAETLNNKDNMSNIDNNIKNILGDELPDNLQEVIKNNIEVTCKM